MKFSAVITTDRSHVHAKSQGQRSKVKVTKVKTYFIPLWAFPDCNSSLNSHVQSFQWHRRGARLFFAVILQISRSQGLKNHWFWPKLSVYGLQLQIEFTHGYKTMYKAWSGTKEVPHCFSRSPVEIQGDIGQKLTILTKIGCFQTLTPVWTHKWLWNDAQGLKWHRRGPLFVFLDHPSNF